jgi:hypothetical protein
MSSADIIDMVPLRRPGRDGDEVRLRIELGKHVPSVVAEPLRFCVGCVRRKRDRPAHLYDHFRNGLPDPPEHIVVLVEIGRTHAGRGIANVEMQHRRAGVVAIDCGLNLLVPGERNVGVAR